MEEISLFAKIRETIRKHLKWYSYPVIYFMVTGLVCAYSWYSRPIQHREGIRVIFKTISVIPALIWAGAITAWIAVAALSILISSWAKKNFPELSVWKRVEGISKPKEDSLSEKSAAPSSLRKIVNVSSYVLGTVLISAGVILAIWISRPYINLLLSASKIEALEQKVKLGQVQGNRIIIPSVLVDAPIWEGVNMGQLSRGVCHASNSKPPGEGGNCIIEGHNLAEFGWWKPQSFFSMLEVVEKGTPIYVFYNGKKYIYRVRDKTYKNVNDPKLYDTTPGERLTLLTCVSTWSPTIYTNRRTVIVAYPDTYPAASGRGRDSFQKKRHGCPYALLSNSYF